MVAECGPSFTSKAEGMLKDMDASKKLMKEFKVKLRDIFGKLCGSSAKHDSDEFSYRSIQCQYFNTRLLAGVSTNTPQSSTRGM
jgi:hypothetical protein